MSGMLDMDYPKSFFDAWFIGLKDMKEKTDAGIVSNEGLELKWDIKE